MYDVGRLVDLKWLYFHLVANADTVNRGDFGQFLNISGFSLYKEFLNEVKKAIRFVSNETKISLKSAN